MLTKGWKNLCPLFVHLPISAATLMQILKRAELVCRPCIAMAMQTGRNPFFSERHCRLGYLECNACDIKRKGSQGENQTLQQPEVWQTELQDDDCKGCTFCWFSTVGILRVIREGVSGWMPLIYKENLCKQTNTLRHINISLLARRQNFWDSWF